MDTALSKKVYILWKSMFVPNLGIWKTWLLYWLLSEHFFNR